MSGDSYSGCVPVIIAGALIFWTLRGCEHQEALKRESRVEAATEQALESVSDSSFADYGDTGECTEDCSGHEAGYEWAKDREVEDEVDCSGNSESFIDGCRAYARARESAVEDAVDAAEY